MLRALRRAVRRLRSLRPSSGSSARGDESADGDRSGDGDESADAAGTDDAEDDDGPFAFSLLDRSVQSAHGVQTDQPERAIRELEAKAADLEDVDRRRGPSDERR